MLKRITGQTPKDNLIVDQVMDLSGSAGAAEERILLTLLQLLEQPQPDPFSGGFLYLPLYTTGGSSSGGGGEPMEISPASATPEPLESASTTTAAPIIDISVGTPPPPPIATRTDISCAETLPEIVSIWERLASSWEDRQRTPPPRGAIRLLDPPSDPSSNFITHYWARDHTLAEWHETLANLDREHTAMLPNGAGESVSVTTSASSILGPSHCNAVRKIFYDNQRKRWLARKAINLWRYRIWAKRPQCGVDLIEMGPVSDRDAVFVTDTANKTVYKFHRRDIYNCLLSNICMSDEMLPCPRAPTNPWTNAPLTLGQTISVCQQLVADYARRGRCPPVLFAAFCTAGYNLNKFLSTNSSLLSQYAITAYFKDIHDHNRPVVVDTILQLLNTAGVSYSLPAVRRWFRQTPITPLHREWLAFARDYTLYLNLHVQTRETWYTEEYIYRDVRRLYSRTNFADPAGPRLALLRDTVRQPVLGSMPYGVLDTVAGSSFNSLSALLTSMPLIPPSTSSLSYIFSSYYDLSGNSGHSR